MQLSEFSQGFPQVHHSLILLGIATVLIKNHSLVLLFSLTITFVRFIDVFYECFLFDHSLQSCLGTHRDFRDSALIKNPLIVQPSHELA